MPPGRPSVYDDSFCERVVALGDGGASVAEIAHELGVTRETVYAWERTREDFSDAMARARLASQVWWEKKGREGLEKATFNASVWSRSMAARFPEDWRDKKEIELSGHVGGALDALPDA